MDHSTVTTFFEIKRAYNTSSTYNHQSKHGFHGNCGIEKRKALPSLEPSTKFWLCCYPHPVDCLHDNGTEFGSADFQEILQSYGI
jgi:hypothetical protein